ncbi:MAG TPA: F0F1 ATP synthase subunit delta [Candidatus Sulfotelmatobacter sp.]|nr:F0F1 ATP synthase subunit delta [Candidatus Sulfotelmatobacter sp.]
MKTPRTEISQVLADKLLKSGVTRASTRSIAAYLLSEGRTQELDSILRDIQADWAAKGFVQVIASSAHKLGPSSNKLITKKVKSVYPGAKKINIAHEFDENILGGVKLEFASQRLDLSLKSKLNKFEELARKKG